jgi:hypothetical protein
MMTLYLVLDPGAWRAVGSSIDMYIVISFATT